MTTRRLLKILVLPPCHTWKEELAALVLDGHTVSDGTLPETIVSLEGYDLVIGAACWRMPEVLRAYLPATIKTVQALAYPTKKKVQK